jgi:hypothetical protein
MITNNKKGISILTRVISVFERENECCWSQDHGGPSTNLKAISNIVEIVIFNTIAIIIMVKFAQPADDGLVPEP